jgi:hypothetical protein
MPPELDFRALRSQVESVTRVPDFAAVARRARKVRRRDRLAVAGALLGTLAVFSPIAVASVVGGTVAGPAMLGRPDGNAIMPHPTESTIYDSNAQLPKVTATVLAVGGAMPDDVFAAVDACSAPADDPTHARCSLQVSLLSKTPAGTAATAIVSSLVRANPSDQVEGVRLVPLTSTSVLLSASVVGGAPAALRITETGAAPIHAPTVTLPLDPGARPVQLVDHGAIYGVRETDGQLGRLASQPALTAPTVQTSVPPGTGWWVSGYDTTTGQASVAVSHDQGQHWVVRSLDVTALDVPTLTTSDGTVTEAFVRFNRGIRHFRSTDDGTTWTETLPQIPLPGMLAGDGALAGRDFGALARADHSLLIWVADTTPVYLNSTDGRTFQAYQGPSGQVYAVDGGYVALGSKPEISLDCVNWAPATLPAPVAPVG